MHSERSYEDISVLKLMERRIYVITAKYPNRRNRKRIEEENKAMTPDIM